MKDRNGAKFLADHWVTAAITIIAAGITTAAAALELNSKSIRPIQENWATLVRRAGLLHGDSTHEQHECQSAIAASAVSSASAAAGGCGHWCHRAGPNICRRCMRQAFRSWILRSTESRRGRSCVMSENRSCIALTRTAMRSS